MYKMCILNFFGVEQHRHFCLFSCLSHNFSVQLFLFYSKLKFLFETFTTAKKFTFVQLNTTLICPFFCFATGKILLARLPKITAFPVGRKVNIMTAHRHATPKVRYSSPIHSLHDGTRLTSQWIVESSLDKMLA